MNIKRYCAFTALVCLPLLTSRRADANLLVNGDFEAGNTGFTSGYTFTSTNLQPAGVYAVVANPHNLHPLAQSFTDHTSGHGLMIAFNGSTDGGITSWSETVPVTPNTSYEFVGWIANWTAAQFNDPGSTLDLVINSAVISNPVSPSTSGLWQEFTANWNSGSATSATIGIADQRVDSGGNDYALDDLSFNAVAAPEPSSIALFVFGSAAMLYRRRLSRKATVI
jgi:hypothetical protein